MWIESRKPNISRDKVNELTLYTLIHNSYQPNLVRGVQIPKPDGSNRQLGIPTVLDRVIQQAILQVLEPIFEPTFSDSSYGFRPNRSALMALAQARDYVQDGHIYVVDMDLEKFFDRVNHDILMSKLARRIGDKRLLKILRRYLETGMMQAGVFTNRELGVMQGGNLSPLLSNVMLDELDKAGFPTDQLDEDKRGLIDGMVGAGLHIKSEPVKDAEGKTRRHKSKDGREYDTTKIWPTKVNKLPWDDKAGAKKGAAKGKATEKAAAKEEPGEPVDVEQGMKDLITELVANAKDNILQKSGVMSALVKKWEGDARKAAIKLAQDAEFLKSIDGIKFDGSTLTFG